MAISTGTLDIEKRESVLSQMDVSPRKLSKHCVIKIAKILCTLVVKNQVVFINIIIHVLLITS